MWEELKTWFRRKRWHLRMLMMSSENLEHCAAEMDRLAQENYRLQTELNKLKGERIRQELEAIQAKFNHGS